MSKRRNLIVIALAVFVALFINACSGASSAKPYNLTKDEAIKTEWGAIIQFKIDEDWEEDEFYSEYDFFQNDEKYTTSYHSQPRDDGSEDYIYISIMNTDHEYYSNESTNTYAGFREDLESYKEMFVEDNDDLKSEDVSIEEQEPITIDGIEYRVYRLSFEVSYSDEQYEKIKENYPEIPQNDIFEQYYAVVKDGEHDMEIESYDKELLIDFANAVEVKW